jgi:predicted nucleic acid-binding Zn ribbon protein
MDNIDRIMKEADRLGFGVSYGKYRAAYPNGSGDVYPTAPKKKPPDRPSASCRYCGKAFVQSHASQAYCSEECREVVFRDRQRRISTRKSKVPKVAMCAICGADFKPKTSAAKYCCRECAIEGRRKADAAWHAAHKKGSP